MEYTHITRIGNEGDAVKHSVLARLVNEILRNRPPVSFGYAETHTGRAEYRLPATGRWTQGIGKLSEKLRSIPLAVPGASNSPHGEWEGLAPYAETCFTEAVRPGGMYPGSSGIVFKMIRKATQNFRFHLWDVDPAVCHSLLGFYENWPEVSICRGDGYEGINKLENLSFALIHPVAMDAEKEQILTTLENLSGQDVPFLCWTALVKGKDRLHEEFKRLTQNIYSVHWVTWRLVEGMTFGCQITVPDNQHEIVRSTLNALSTLLSWRQESFSK